MGFEPGVDRTEVSDMTEAGYRAAATQIGEHLDVALPEGGDLYLAWTTLGALDLLACLKCCPCGLRAGTNSSPNDIRWVS